ncbi:4'-phosphopantetheinyl transferase family protein [Streptomyces spororaveus]|uniref:4'-phosphopantetheinyl transferase family protein n=1 Tax=Streptomyces spororaveus TaxID=284039 RepID=UPI0036A6DC2D
MIALSDHAVVGVDVERVPARPLTGALHPEEEDELALLNPADRPAAFARAWTRKEAVLKALGAGLQTDPPSYAATRADPLPLHEGLEQDPDR